MTMNFAVLEGVPLDELEDGQNIHFSMIEDSEGGWVIDQIHVMNAAADNEARRDD